MRRLALVLPLVLGLCAYVNTAHNGWALDDWHFIVENPAIRTLNPLPRFLHATVTDGGAFFRPIAIETYAIDYALTGGTPAFMHLVGVCWHLLATLLLVLLVLRLATPGAALAAGLVFALHPVHTEAVACVSNRPEVIATAIYLGALLVELRETKWRWFWQPLLCFVALCTKESAITLPLAIAALVFYFRRGRGFWVAPLRVLPGIAVYLILRWHALGGVTYVSSPPYFLGTPAGVRALTVLKIVPLYARLLVAPTVLSADYSRSAIPDAHGLEWSVLAGMVIVMVLVMVLVRGRGLLAFGGALLAIGMLPYAQITPIGVLVAERFLYLPSIGLALMIAAAVAFVLARRVRPVLVWAPVAILASAFLVRTIDRNRDWRDPLTLWETTVEVVPDSSFAHANLALSAWWAGQKERGVRELELAVRMSPDNPAFRATLEKMRH